MAARLTALHTRYGHNKEKKPSILARNRTPIQMNVNSSDVTQNLTDYDITGNQHRRYELYTDDKEPSEVEEIL
jgi:hypothetical protein